MKKNSSLPCFVLDPTPLFKIVTDSWERSYGDGTYLGSGKMARKWPLKRYVSRPKCALNGMHPIRPPASAGPRAHKVIRERVPGTCVKPRLGWGVGTGTR